MTLVKVECWKARGRAVDDHGRQGHRDGLRAIGVDARRHLVVLEPHLAPNCRRTADHRRVHRPHAASTLIRPISNDEATMPGPDPEAAAAMSDSEPLLPETLAKWLSVDLSVTKSQSCWHTRAGHLVRTASRGSATDMLRLQLTLRYRL